MRSQCGEFILCLAVAALALASALSPLGGSAFAEEWRPSISEADILADGATALTVWRDGSVILSDVSGQRRHVVAKVDPAPGMTAHEAQVAQDESRVLISTAYNSEVLSLPDGDSVFRYAAKNAFGHRAWMSRGGDKILIYDEDIMVLDVKTGDVVANIADEDGLILENAAFLPDGRVALFFYARNSGKIVVLEPNSGVVAWSRNLSTYDRSGVYFNDQATRLFVWSDGGLMLDTADGRVSYQGAMQTTGRLSKAKWAASGDVFAFANDDSFVAVSATSGKVIAEGGAALDSIDAVSADSMVVTMQRHIQKWIFGRARPPSTEGVEGRVEAVAPNGEVLLISTSSGPELFGYRLSVGKTISCFSAAEAPSAGCHVNELRGKLRRVIDSESDFRRRYLVARELMDALDGARLAPSPFWLLTSEDEYVAYVLGVSETLLSKDMTTEARELYGAALGAKSAVARVAGRAGMGYYLLTQGKNVEAAGILRAALEEYERLPADERSRTPEAYAAFLRLAAQGELAVGRPQVALERADAAVAVLEKLVTPQSMDRALQVRASALAAQGQSLEAATMRRDLIDEQDNTPLNAAQEIELSRNLAAQGRASEADLWASRAIDIYENMGPPDSSRLIGALAERGRIRASQASGLSLGLEDLRRAAALHGAKVDAGGAQAEPASSRQVYRWLVAASWMADRSLDADAATGVQAKATTTDGWGGGSSLGRSTPGFSKIRRGHGSSISSLMFSADGKLLLSGGGDDVAILWQIDHPNLKLILDDGKYSGLSRFAAFGKNEILVVTSDDIQKIDISTGKVKSKREIESRIMPEFAYDGRYVVGLPTNGKGRESVEIFEVEGSSSRFDVQVSKAGRTSPDGRLLAMIGPNDGEKVCIYDIVSTKEQRCFKPPPYMDSAIAWSPDGKRLAVGGQGAAILDASDGRVISELAGHTEYIEDMAFSPDGAQIATASEDKTARIWSTTTGREVRRLEGHGQPLTRVAWSPGAGVIATGAEDGGIRLWDADSGAPLALLGGRAEGHHGGVVLALFSPDERRVITTGADETLRMWDAATGEQLLMTDTHGSWYGGVPQYSADGKWLFVPLQGILNASTGVEEFEAGDSEFFGSGARFVTWDGGEAVVGDAVDEAVVQFRVDGEIPDEGGVAGAADGRRLAIIAHSDDDETGSLSLWNAKIGKRLSHLEFRGDLPQSVEFSPDSNYIAVVFQREVRLYRASDGGEVRRLSPSGQLAKKRNDNTDDEDIFGTRSIALARADFSRDGGTLLAWSPADVWDDDGSSVSPGVVLWQIADGKGPVVVRPPGGITAIAISPDGSEIALGDAHGNVLTHSTVDGRQLRRFKVHDGSVWSIRYSRDGKNILTAAADNLVRITAAADGRVVRTIGE